MSIRTLAARTIVAARVATASPLRLAVRGYATAGRRYTKDHEWVVVSEDGKIGTMGITDYAAKALGDVVFVELPEVGKTVAIKDTIGAVESVKAASDIYAPISGEIVEANEALEAESGLINESPFDEGWLCKIKISNEAELEALLDEAAYLKLTSE
ncbi:hypothetical protein GGF31_007159 [Allomyces arbusculus]|nr:hypothetical protein GGF31_007159 [Allomyces arbusculus]